MVAPSFPADDCGEDAERLVGALRPLGFSHVVEVAFGADLTSRAYQAYIKEHPTGTRVATACPAVAEYVRKYNPDLVGCLIPIVSPMIATAMAVQAIHGKDHACVFIGPCVAKKREMLDPQARAVVQAVLTFDELRRLFAERRARRRATPSDFDPPHAGSGRLYPFVGGLLKGAGIERNTLNAEVMALSGASEILECSRDLSPDDPSRSSRAAHVPGLLQRAGDARGRLPSAAQTARGRYVKSRMEEPTSGRHRDA